MTTNIMSWLNSPFTVVVPSVGQGTTEPTTQTAGGFASDATTAVGAVPPDSSLNESALTQAMIDWQMNQILGQQPSLYQLEQEQTILNTSYPTLDDIGLMSPQQSDEVFSIPNTMTNSSMSTKTKKVPYVVYNPVTLTLTGQLKPSTLTKAPAAKSSPSTKKKVVVPQGMWAYPPSVVNAPPPYPPETGQEMLGLDW